MKVPEPRKLPSGNWFIQLRLGGKSYSVTERSKKECIHQAELLKAQHQMKKKVSYGSRISLKDAIDEYINNKSAVLSPETVRGYRVIQKNRFKDYKDLPISSVNWQKAVNDEAKHLSAKTVSNSWALVSSVMKENGFDVPKVTLPQIVSKEHEWLTPEQIPIFLNAVKGHREELPALLALHGLRRSEIYALDASSFSNDIIHVRGAVVHNENEEIVRKKENKNTTSRRDVPIVIPRLKELLAENPNFYDCPITYLTKAINNTCQKAGLSKVGTHGLRHSYASLCIHAGLTEMQIQRLGGWKDPATMRKIYAHISNKDMESAANKLSDFFTKNANENAN